MLKKIRFKGEPGNTLSDEIKKGLARYRYPIFGCMIAFMLGSLVLAFTVMRQEKPRPLPSLPKAALTSGPGITGALATYADLQAIAALQDRIERIASKKELTITDSVAVLTALKQIDSLYNTIKHQTPP